MLQRKSIINVLVFSENFFHEYWSQLPALILNYAFGQGLSKMEETICNRDSLILMLISFVLFLLCLLLNFSHLFFNQVTWRGLKVGSIKVSGLSKAFLLQGMMCWWFMLVQPQSPSWPCRTVPWWWYCRAWSGKGAGLVGHVPLREGARFSYKNQQLFYTRFSASVGSNF